METKDYWIYDNKIIFKPNFNNKLDDYDYDYIDIISKHNELIFSNYNDCSITIKTNNIYCNKYKQNYKESNFNQQVIIPQNVTHLTFGNNFNQQVTIPQNVTHLTFGKEFNQRVNLPNIKYLQIDCNNIDIIENLPNSIEEIIFGMWFNLKLQNLPNSIKKISFYYDSRYNNELNCLPEFVEYLELGKDYDKKITKFPLNLKTIKCSKYYKYIDDFKDKYNVITY